jgi:hypothetical protein
MVQPWTFLNSRIIQSCRIFQLKNERYRSPRRGQEHEFYLSDSLDWANVIPQSAEGRSSWLSSIVSELRDSPWRFLVECSTMGKPRQERSAASFLKKPGIEVLSFPLSEIPRLIHDGKTCHALVVAASYWSFSIAGFEDRQPASEEVREKFGTNLCLHTSRRIWGER